MVQTVTCNRPRRGPLYWDFRCLTCDGAIALHDPWWRRCLNRWRKRG